MTFDKDLMYSQMKAVGDEFYGKGFQVLNAPTSGPFGRSPWGGRLVETMGQDTYLNGQLFGLATQAFNDAGVVPGGKVRIPLRDPLIVRNRELTLHSTFFCMSKRQIAQLRDCLVVEEVAAAEATSPDHHRPLPL